MGNYGGNTYTFQAGEDLNTDGHEGVAIALADNKVANDGLEADGVLLTKPKSGEHGTIGVDGIRPIRAGAAIAQSARVMVTTSGYFTTCVSGFYGVGRALEAITSGSIGDAHLHFGGIYWTASRG